jgi:hypothetical protein
MAERPVFIPLEAGNFLVQQRCLAYIRAADALLDDQTR